MKKILFLIVALLGSIGISNAAKTVVYSDAVLPANAKATLNTYFNSKVNHVKIDKNLLGNVEEYDVVLKNGTEVEFDGQGNLREVDAGSNAVPSGLILNPIRDYVKKNCGNKKVVQLEIKKNGYEIELVDGRELTFDRSGKFIKENR